jgi:hypothetical protein
MTFPADKYQALIAFYGDPDANNDAVADTAWESANLIAVDCPWTLKLAWDLSKSTRKMRVHKKCAESLSGVLGVIWTHYGRSQANIEAARMHLYGGGYMFRRARGLSRLSTHAFGAAIDLDPSNNGLGKAWKANSGMMPQPVIDAFQQAGWTWGGKWSRPDAMHFQAATP